MIQNPKRSFKVFVSFALAFAAIALFVAGFWTCKSLFNAFDHLRRIQIAQAAAQSALTLQLLEDAELQEYDRFGRRYFYEPQLVALESSKLRLAELAAVACCGHRGDRSYSETQNIATTWKKQIAGPIFARSQGASSPRSLLVATYDKILIDEFNAEFGKIDELLTVEAERAAVDALQAVDRIVYIFAGLVVAFVSVPFAAGWLQARERKTGQPAP